jgi:hypothetical protein
MKFAIIGYGAAGTFAALQLRQALKEQGRTSEQDQIYILEKNRQGLRKVKISGGGRCNVTHYQPDIRSFTKNYPRGEKELIGPFHGFDSQMTIEWFQARGVKLKVEEDGRMFPTTNSSQTIIDCFEKELQKNNIELRFQQKISSITYRPAGNFELKLATDESFNVDAVMLATGSDPSGHALANSLGHKITELAPSLFTFKIKDPLLGDLAGTSFKQVEIKIHGLKKKWQQTGPLLITHWGLSGPCVLKLSAWAARELKKVNYQFSLTVNFLGLELEAIKDNVNLYQDRHGQKLVQNVPLTGLTKNFWRNFLQQISKKYPKIKDKSWQELSKKEKEAISSHLYAYPLENRGQSRFKEEFVECGGVSTKEVDFKTMESKIVPGLYFGGELLDIDGITGGFNFQNAWTTGFIAGENMAKKV